MFKKQPDETALDFARDPSAEDESQHTMPLLGALGGGGGASASAGDDDLAFDSADENKRIATQSALLIAIVAVIAGGVLFGMRLTTGGNTVQAATEQLSIVQSFIRKADNPELVDPNDAQHPKNLAGMFADTDTIVSKIATDYPEKAVPLEEVQKNPFELIYIASADEANPTDFAEKQRIETLRRLEGEFRQLELQSIMGSGRRSVAVIDGEFYRLGARIGSFRVAGIKAGRVGLLPVDFETRPGDPRFILEIQAEAAVDTGRR